MENLKTLRSECQIEEILDTPEELQAHIKYMRDRFYIRLREGVKAHIAGFFDLEIMENAIKDGIPIAMQIGSVSGLKGTRLEGKKAEVIDSSRKLLENAGFFVTSAETIGYGPGKGKGDPKHWIFQGCSYILLACDILVPVSVGCPSTGTGEEMGFGRGIDIPCVALEYNYLPEPNHFFNSSSTGGYPGRIFFSIDVENLESSMVRVETFYRILHTAIEQKTLGICYCSSHDRTFYIQTKSGGKQMCLHGFVQKLNPDQYKDPFKSRSEV